MPGRSLQRLDSGLLCLYVEDLVVEVFGMHVMENEMLVRLFKSLLTLQTESVVNSLTSCCPCAVYCNYRPSFFS